MRCLYAVMACCGIFPQVHAGGMADVEIYDRTAHKTLPIHEHRGRRYVAGEPRHQYELRVRSRSSERVLAVVSVDGVNVLSGKTAATDQGGYVIDSWASIAIVGWRKSLQDVATFYFTPLGDSYAARTGRPDHVGVIGVALFRERTRCCAQARDQLAAPNESAPAAPQAPSRATEKETRSAEYSTSRSEAPLGTGHGHRERSLAEYVAFERASQNPDETIAIYYDSHANLVARGVLPERARLSERLPDPFPDGFVPDP